MRDQPNVQQWQRDAAEECAAIFRSNIQISNYTSTMAGIIARHAPEKSNVEQVLFDALKAYADAEDWTPELNQQAVAAMAWAMSPTPAPAVPAPDAIEKFLASQRSMTAEESKATHDFFMSQFPPSAPDAARELADALSPLVESPLAPLIADFDNARTVLTRYRQSTASPKGTEG